MSLTKVSYSMITGAPVNVLDYGASPSASGAANLSAIQAAIDSLPNTGGSVYIPAGNYTIDGTITFPTNNIILFGDGGVGYEAITDKGTTLNFTNATIGFDLTSNSPTGTFGSEINNLLIYGNSVLKTGVKSSRKLSMTNVCITGCVDEGLWLWDWTLSSNFYSCGFNYNSSGAGIRISGTDTGLSSRITTATFYSCVVRRNGTGLSVTDINGLTFRDTIFESNYGSGIVLDGYSYASYPSISQVLFDASYTENNGLGPAGNQYLYAPVILIDNQSATPATAIGPQQIVFRNMSMSDGAGKRLIVNVGNYITVENCFYYAPYQPATGISYFTIVLSAYASYVSFINTLTPFTIPTPSTDPGIDNQVYIALTNSGTNNSVINGGSCISGYWTPELKIGGSATGITYVARSGVFTRNGESINLTGYIQLLSKGVAVGDVTIAGIPFETVTAIGGSMSFSYVNGVTLTGVLGGRTDANELVLENLLFAGAPATNVTNAALTNTSLFAFSVTYQARVFSANGSRLI
ncbi:Pectate lyase superfamily protein [uncultured Caudovirales phage]|uniref:Pectate lyase superfamily protein n=1 Tax=uncultured Caudovirales phage TaxID=2100421 RepID=A0A6J5R4C7_9CAUD|nr:Pectate lyase superfamily protein [uncultured Caudovirales phage]